MGEVIYVDFRNEWDADDLENFLFEELEMDEEPLCIEIVDEITGDVFFYYEEDMSPDPTDFNSFKALSRMIDEM